MPSPYLIAHLCRGQPTFDIAQRLCEGEAPCQPSCGCYPECKEEEWWIIPTSGHRAYPYWRIGLDDLMSREDSEWLVDPWQNIPSPPPNHPDHYAINNANHQSLPDPKQLSLLDALGLRTQTKIVRRM